jgi:hypothetical protein
MNFKPSKMKVIIAIIVFFISDVFFCTGVVCNFASGLFNLEAVFFPMRFAFALGAYFILSFFES